MGQASDADVKRIRKLVDIADNADSPTGRNLLSLADRIDADSERISRLEKALRNLIEDARVLSELPARSGEVTLQRTLAQSIAEAERLLK